MQILPAEHASRASNRAIRVFAEFLLRIALLVALLTIARQTSAR